MPAGIRGSTPAHGNHHRGADRQAWARSPLNAAIVPPEPYKGKASATPTRRSRDQRDEEEADHHATKKNSACAARVRPASASPTQVPRPDGESHQPAHLRQRGLGDGSKVLASTLTAEAEVRKHSWAAWQGWPRRRRGGSASASPKRRRLPASRRSRLTAQVRLPRPRQALADAAR